MLLNKRADLPNSVLPCSLNYSERASQNYYLSSIADENIRNLLSRFQWIAKIQLKYFWRAIAVTNIKEFDGRLSKDLILEILALHFPIEK